MMKQHINLIVFALCASAPVSNADLIAYWPFDEGVGEVAQDEVGGFDGTIIGGTWLAPGKVGASAYQGLGGDEITSGAEASPTTKDLTLAADLVTIYSSGRVTRTAHSASASVAGSPTAVGALSAAFLLTPTKTANGYTSSAPMTAPQIPLAFM
jgi:hypothetical protein